MLDFVDSEIQSLEKALDSGAHDFDPSNEEMVKAETSLRLALKTCKQNRRAFDSETFFIVIFGSVKAGKSTLVNAFVGKDVSPTGQSVETTMRSSVILPAKPNREEGIYVYHPGLDNKKSPDERCRDLIDYLGGLTPEDDFLKEYTLKVFPLRKENRDRFLTLKDGNDPEFPSMLPPVIRIDVSKSDERINILMDDVAVMDTPGLDGSTIDASRDMFWKILPEKGDLFLLVQSSMSAINNQCFERIREIHSKTKNVPMIIVYNRIAARSWKRDEVEEEHMRKSAQAAAKDLGDKFNEFLHRDPPPQYQVNAGEAFDVVSEEVPEEDLKPEYRQGGERNLLVESCIDQLKREIRNTLKTHRYRYKIESAKERMANDVARQAKTVVSSKETLSSSLIEDRKKFEAEKRTAQDNRSKFANAFSGSGVGKRLAEEAGGCFQKLFEENVDEFKESFEKLADEKCHFNESHEHISRAKAEKQLHDLIATINRRFVSRLAKHFPGPRLRLDLDIWRELLESNKQGLSDLFKWRVASTGQSSQLMVEDTGKHENDEINQDFCNLLFSTVKAELIQQAVSFSTSFSIPDLPTRIQRWYFKTDKIPDPIRSCEALSCQNDLIDEMKTWFTEVAPKKVNELIENAIIENGDRLGIELEQSARIYFETRDNDLKQHEERARRIIALLDEAKSHLSNIVQSLNNSNQGE